MESGKLRKAVDEILRCPICSTGIEIKGETILCKSPDCQARFPIVEGIPILINEQNSAFTIGDFLANRQTTFNLKESKVKKIARSFVPDISHNLKAKQNYAKFAEILLSQSPSPRVLVVGGGILGAGMEPLLDPKIELYETDVSFGPRTELICDSHDIPFQDNSFDGVIAQAVLEHVMDPYRCTSEMQRVLKGNGLIYAETPFMQQVHMGRYDFTRFTHLGHRRLFKAFDEIDSGACGGPGMAFAWSYKYLLLSFFTNRQIRLIVKGFAGFTSFFFKYLDYLMIQKPGSLDAASGVYFLGRKSKNILSDREILALYKGSFE